MKRVDVKTNFSCNNKCVFCVQGNKRYRHEDKSTERVKEILREAKDKHDMVVFTGGEITIRKDLPELVSYAKGLGFKKIQMQTNGRMFAYKKFCRTIINAGADEFGLALHGPTAEIHDRLTGAEGAFKQTTAGIKNLKSMGQWVNVNCVVTKPGYKRFPELADLLIDLGVDQYQFAFIHINRIIADDPSLIEEIVPRKSDVMPYLKKGLDKGVRAGVRVMTEAIPFCLMEGYEQFIAENGKIPGGDVYDADFSIEDYENYRKAQGKVKAEKCKKCKYYKVCEGPWKEYPDIFGWDEFKPVTD